MKKILLGTMMSIVLIASVEKWGIYIGFNVRFFELLLAPFFLAAVVYLANLRTKVVVLPPALLSIIRLKWAYVAIAAASGLVILIAPVDANSAAFYGKGLLQLVVWSAFLTIFGIVLATLRERERTWVLYGSLAGVTISAIYGLGQGALMAVAGIDLDGLISNHIPAYAGTDAPTLEKYGYGAFYRLNGLAGDPNVMAATEITALPLIVALFIERRRWYWAVLVGIYILMLLMTMSVSGMIGVAASLLVLAVFYWRSVRLIHMAYSTALIAALVGLGNPERDEIERLAGIKTDPTGSVADHLAVLSESLGSIYKKYPLGVGYNNFSLAWWRLCTTADYQGRDMNPHNTFVAVLIESGPAGLVVQLGFYGAMAVVAVRRKTLLGRAFLASLVGMMVDACGYETLDMFYAQTFLMLGFTCVVMDKRSGYRRSPSDCPHRAAGGKLEIRRGEIGPKRPPGST